MPSVQKLKDKASDFNILYVEDEPDIRTSVGTYLRKIFLNVDTAEDGQDGLNYFKENDYDIVLTDIQMPHMNGIEMSCAIKSIKPEQEIIIISAYSESSYFIDAIKLGISAYILKPISYEQMNTCLYKTVTNIQRHKENIMYKKNLEELVEKRTKEIVKLEEDKIENYENTLLSFVEMVEDRDTYTGGHSKRVAKYCKLIAEHMEYSKEDVDLIYRAGILHDIGKIATPDSILLKPGHLSDLEYKLIKEHVQVSYNLLSKIPMYKDISNIIIYHHERYDGIGYPNGVEGENIPALARIMIVADSFDAMTTNRIYKARKNIVEAIEELKSLSGVQFDPDVVKSAAEALLDVEIHESITQLPSSEIEKERFAYFYRDQVTQAYNTEYLDFILHRNSIERTFNSINVLQLSNFSAYNQKFGWTQGNNMLNSIVDYIKSEYPSSAVVRFHGDDFIVISHDKLKIDMSRMHNHKMFNEYYIHVTNKYIDLTEHEIFSYEELVSFLSTSDEI